MNSQIHPMIYDKKHYTVMANDIVRGKQDMTLQEARILRLLITQIVKVDSDFKTYSCKITDLSTFLNISSNNLYRDIRDICRNLMQRTVEISTGNEKDPWRIFQWLQKAEYDGSGNVTLMLSNQIAPYVLELNKYFTQYQLENILELSSFYSIRLYELLKSNFFKNEILYQEYSLDFLRRFFDCVDKYERISQFKEKVLEISIREINEKTDIYISEAIQIKTGRKITGFRFEVRENFENNERRNIGRLI